MALPKKVTGMKLKVSWRKIKKRVQVLLSNEFKIREWWRMCFPDKPMRWLSLDQKPSWWNNAGLTGTWARRGGSQPSVTENFAHTRARYSILTAVPYGWDMRDHVCPTAENVPLIAMLFKGKSNGKIIKKLKNKPSPQALDEDASPGRRIISIRRHGRGARLDAPSGSQPRREHHCAAGLVLRSPHRRSARDS